MIQKQLLTAWLALFVGIAVLIIPDRMPAQDKAFSGPYAGGEVGRQNIIGGSLIDNIDFLSHDTRRVFALQAGARYQFDFGLVVGIEGSVGRMDGKLALSDPAKQLDITYDNDRQTTVGLISGFALGPQKRWLLFGYLSEATRKFDVMIKREGTRFEQRDEQGFLRFGIGVEKQFLNRLNLRISAGSGRAAFGDRQTNMKVTRKVEFGVAALIQL